jgi:hypothetical protein
MSFIMHKLGDYVKEETKIWPGFEVAVNDMHTSPNILNLESSGK